MHFKWRNIKNKTQTIITVALLFEICSTKGKGLIYKLRVLFGSSV